jgi:hypothetical protein
VVLLVGVSDNEVDGTDNKEPLISAKLGLKKNQEEMK